MLRLETIAVYSKEDGSFSIRFRHPESGFGHDKSEALRPYMHQKGERPVVLFCGDGVSDLSAGMFLYVFLRLAAVHRLILTPFDN